LYSSHMPTPRTLIITGASRGIGAAIALKAGCSDYRVVVNYAKDRRAADQIVDQIREAGGNAISIAADISVELEVIRLFQEAEHELGPIYGLVNNAGIAGGVLWLLSPEASYVTGTILEIGGGR
jgi:NAD(P)-dependent dehydrogenase (short-subunit alcohol dehydrogenase family)